MNKKVKEFLIIQILLIVIVSIVISACSPQADYSGVYLLSMGNCSSKYISLKMVKGFGKKYYIVTIYKDDYIKDSGTEFLGVVTDNNISVKNGTIIINGSSLTVVSGDKTCLYGKIDIAD